MKILKVRNDGTAIVSTRGLRRVVIQPGNEIADELLTVDEAAAFVEGFNSPSGEFRAKVVKYPQLRRK